MYTIVPEYLSVTFVDKSNRTTINYLAHIIRFTYFASNYGKEFYLNLMQVKAFWMFKLSYVYIFVIKFMQKMHNVQFPYVQLKEGIQKPKDNLNKSDFLKARFKSSF